MADYPKIVHFIFLAICTLLIGRIFSLSSLNFSLIYIVYAVLAFAIVYFPFTSQAFDFYRLPLGEKLHKYFKRIIIVDLFIGVGGSIPYLFCLISRNSECYVALLSIGIWFALVTIIGVQIVTFGIISVMHGLEKIPSKLKYSAFLIIIIFLVFLNFFTFIIPGSRASTDSNTYFEGTKQCEKLDIFNIPESELSRIGCRSFYMFDENGNPVSPYKNVAPTSKSEIGSNVYSASDHVPDITSYGFNEDISYFEACKVILTDYINWKKKACESA